MITQQKRRQQRKNRLKQISILNPCHINDLFIYIYKLQALYCKRFYLVVHSIYLFTIYLRKTATAKSSSQLNTLDIYMQKKRYFQKYVNSNPLKLLEKKNAKCRTRKISFVNIRRKFHSYSGVPVFVDFVKTR